MAKTYKQRFNEKHNQPKDKSNSIKEIATKSKISLKQIKKIIEKGEAAFYNNRSSVRPQIKSATAWGIARAYSAVMGGAAAKVDKEELRKGKIEYKKNLKKKKEKK